tara:strand:- start:346 stop:498 length:153 start_codon:yes stop_codon:yes gene_type:complete
VKSIEEDEEKAFPILKIDNNGGGILPKGVFGFALVLLLLYSLKRVWVRVT